MGLGLLAVLVMLLRPREDAGIVGRTFTLPSPGRRIQVEVLNGTRRAGLARAATRTLRRRGLDVVFFGSAPETDSTRILVRRGDASRGRDVAAVLGWGRVVVAPDTLRRVDVTVLLGADWRPRAPVGP